MSEPLYTVMQPRKSPAALTGKDPNYSWIVSDTPHKDLCATLRRLVQDQQPRLWANTRLMSLYANQDLLSAPVAGTGSGRQSRARSMPRQTCNLAKVYGDTLAGKLVQSNSKVTCLTMGGDWSLFRLARKLDSTLEATFRQGRLYQEVSRCAIDAINCGTGYCYVGEEQCGDDDEPSICYERWFPNELFVDQLEAMYGCPTMLFRMRYIKRENALALWGKNEDLRNIIMRAGIAQAPAFAWTMYQPGMIELFEAWALPVGERKGRHVVALSSGTLVDEEWKKERFPVAVFKAGDFPIGWYGQGLLEHAAGAQVHMNRVLNVMARAAELGIAPYWVVEGGADVSLKQISNFEGHIVTSNGAPPQWVTNPPFHPAAEQYTQVLKQQISAIYGINDIEAMASKGYNRVDSDPALTNMQDMWMARHQIMLKNWSEFFFLDLAERTVDLCTDIAERRGSFPVKTVRKGRGEVMDWADFKNIEKNEYLLQMAPMNYLPTTPGAKMQRLLQMKAEGLITPAETLQGIQGPPDVEYLTAQVAAQENDTDRVIGELMDGAMPDINPLQDLGEMIPRVRAAGLVALDRGAPDDVINCFEDWVAAATVEATKAMMPQQAPGGLADGSFGPAGSGIGGAPAGGIPGPIVPGGGGPPAPGTT